MLQLLWERMQTSLLIYRCMYHLSQNSIRGDCGRTTTCNLDPSSYLLVPVIHLWQLIQFYLHQPCFMVQCIMQYLLLIKQIILYAEPNEDQTLTECVLWTAEHILGHINKTVREQEGYEHLREISQDLWLSQGYISNYSLSLHIHQMYPAGSLTSPHQHNVAQRNAQQTRSNAHLVERLRAWL